jgi:hypothetical protein
MKDIKDYLHLYLGCYCKATNHFGAYSFPKITHKLLEEDNPITANCTIEPILRPISDITDEEQLELQVLEMELQDNDSHVSPLEIYAAQCNQCRKWEIDIDGLIEAGLAIPKQKGNCL